MIFHHLVRVWNPRFDQWDRRSFVAEVASDLAHYLDGGPDHMHYLMDLGDWDIERLRTGERWRPLRKPRIDVRVLLTSRDGLALEWAPRGWWDDASGPQERRLGDFFRFDTHREIGDGHPNNRLFYLKDFGVLMSLGRPPKPDEGELIRAVDGFLRQLIDSLRVSFDVRIIEAFEVLEESSARRAWDKYVVGAAIYNVEDRLAEKRQAELAAWEDEHLRPFGLAMATVCKEFQNSQRSAAKAAQGLTKVASKPVTTAQARKWLDALERRLGRFERKAVHATAKVIPLRPSED